MNMAVRIEAPVSDRQNGAETAQGRVREWSRVRHWEAPNSFPASPFAQIAEMQDFASARGVGAKYEMVQEPGDAVATPCKPDGGMTAFCERFERGLPFHIRARETAYAIHGLPEDLRVVIFEMYRVPQRERPKSDRAVAEALSLTRLETIKRLERAYGWLGRDLGLPPI